jgi:hypothetical protein
VTESLCVPMNQEGPGADPTSRIPGGGQPRPWKNCVPSPHSCPPASAWQKGPVMTSHAGNCLGSLGRSWTLGQRAHCHANARPEEGGGSSPSSFGAESEKHTPSFQNSLAISGLGSGPHGSLTWEVAPPGAEPGPRPQHREVAETRTIKGRMRTTQI